MAFDAKHHGRCRSCGEAIAPGDRVRYADDNLIHDDCDAIAIPGSTLNPTELRPGEVVCTSCWLVKPCECEVA